MSVHETEGTLKFARADGTDRVHNIKVYNSSTQASNYMKFQIHAGGASAGTLTDNVLYLRGDGNVGIGTSSPAQKLDVAGRIRCDTMEMDSYIYHVGDADTYFGFDDNDHFRIVEGGGTRFQVDSTGNVGIGTTSPSAPLHIYKASNYPEVYVDYGTGGQKMSMLTGTAGSVIGYSGYLTIGTITGSQGSGFSEKMRITSGGNVGIGTTSPGATLDVVGDVNVSNVITLQGFRITANEYTGLQAVTNADNSTTNAVIISNPTQSTTQTTGALIISGGVGIGKDLFASKIVAGTDVVVGGNIVANADITAEGDLIVDTDTLHINSSTHQVGIGTSTPITGSKLHINGPVYSPGMPVQCISENVHDIVTYAANTTGRFITPLDIVITPKFSNSKIHLQWSTNGEVHHDNVFRIYRDGNLIGYNTNIDSNNRWNGVSVAGIYDRNESSTPCNITITWVDTPQTTNTITYQIYVQSSSTGSYPYYLNRTYAGSDTGQDAYERMVSCKSVMEVAV
jgi:hypothetical protein